MLGSVDMLDADLQASRRQNVDIAWALHHNAVAIAVARFSASI